MKQLNRRNNFMIGIPKVKIVSVISLRGLYTSFDLTSLDLVVTGFSRITLLGALGTDTKRILSWILWVSSYLSDLFESLPDNEYISWIWAYLGCSRDKLKQEDCNGFLLSNFWRKIVNCILTYTLGYNTRWYGSQI